MSKLHSFKFDSIGAHISVKLVSGTEFFDNYPTWLSSEDENDENNHNLHILLPDSVSPAVQHTLFYTAISALVMSPAIARVDKAARPEVLSDFEDIALTTYTALARLGARPFDNLADGPYDQKALIDDYADYNRQKARHGTKRKFEGALPKSIPAKIKSALNEKIDQMSEQIARGRITHFTHLIEGDDKPKADGPKPQLVKPPYAVGVHCFAVIPGKSKGYRVAKVNWYEQGFGSAPELREEDENLDDAQLIQAVKIANSDLGIPPEIVNSAVWAATMPDGWNDPGAQPAIEYVKVLGGVTA